MVNRTLFFFFLLSKVEGEWLKRMILEYGGKAIQDSLRLIEYVRGAGGAVSREILLYFSFK